MHETDSPSCLEAACNIKSVEFKSPKPEGTFSCMQYMRESVMIMKEFDIEVLLNLHIFSSPECEKIVFGILAVCMHMSLAPE